MNQEDCEKIGGTWIEEDGVWTCKLPDMASVETAEEESEM